MKMLLAFFAIFALLFGGVGIVGAKETVSVVSTGQPVEQYSLGGAYTGYVSFRLNSEYGGNDTP